MNRIMIIGFCGAGKSTLARKMGGKLGIEPTYMDALHWLPDWTESTREHKINLLAPVLERERWIVEGSYRKVLYQERLDKADTIIFLDINRFLCLWRVIKRRIMYHGKTRPDMGKDCPERLNAEFLRWVVWGCRLKRGKVYEELDAVRKNYPDKRIYIFRRPKQAEEFLNNNFFQDIERKDIQI